MDDTHSTDRGTWREWLGLGPRRVRSPDPAQTTPRELSPREVWLPAKRRLLGQIADFLIDHDLDVLPFTLTVAYDKISGGSPRLAQRILERTEQGLPITLKWLEATHGGEPPGAVADAVAQLVSRLEDNLAAIGRTMAGARDANGTYRTALTDHVATLEATGGDPADDLIARLTALAGRMLDHARTVECELAERAREIGALEQRLDEARRLANQDHLTGLPNRRAFDLLFDREASAARQCGDALCIAFCDIDHFKRINDAHGHPAGDRVIRHVAECLGRIADARCHVARHGGEEFAILLRGTDLSTAWARLEEAREEIAAKRLVNRSTDRPFGKITFSGGLADALAYPDRTTALKAADDALYAAKSSGRNRIVIAGQEPPPLRVVA